MCSRMHKPRASRPAYPFSEGLCSTTAAAVVMQDLQLRTSEHVLFRLGGWSSEGTCSFRNDGIMPLILERLSSTNSRNEPTQGCVTCGPIFRVYLQSITPLLMLRGLCYSRSFAFPSTLSVLLEVLRSCSCRSAGVTESSLRSPWPILALAIDWTHTRLANNLQTYHMFVSGLLTSTHTHQ